MARVFLLSALLVGTTSAWAQDPNAVTQREIDQAIRKGAEYLKTAPSTGGWLHANCDELILLTMIHAGIPETNPKFEEYLRHCLQAPLEKTYKVALLAMALEELDASGYQMKIAQCAAFLLDNQAANGQWLYGKPVDLKNYPFVEREKKTASDGGKPAGAREFGPTVRERKKPSKAIVVPQTRHEGESGDNSNSQYAALGLRACFDANIKLPADALHLARKWWVESQWPDDTEAKVGKGAVNSGGDTTRVQGWSYKKPGDEGQKAPYHAMTAGAIGATVIIEYMLGRDFKKDAVTRAGVNWIAKNYAVNSNLYYMYALERAGMIYGTEMMGTHKWYPEGAKVLIETQGANGAWGSTVDTCFAILFLKRATRALGVETLSAAQMRARNGK